MAQRFVLTLAAAGAVALSAAGFTAADLALGRVAPALAQSAPAGAQSPRAKFGKMLLTLNLSDAQKDQIRSIMQSTRDQNKNVTDPEVKRANFKAAFGKIETVLTKAQVTKLHAEIDAAKAQRAAEGHGS